MNATETNLRRALSEAGAAEQFADLLIAAAQRLSEPPQVRRSRLGDGVFLAPAPALIGSTASAAWAMVPEEDQAATLLETSLPALTLSGERGFDPEVTLYIEAAVRLLDAQDRSLLWQRSYVYRSPPSAFFDLGKSDAAKLEEVLQRGLAKLAFAASFDVFAARHPEVHPDPDRWSSLPEDTVWAVRRTASPLPSPKPGGCRSRQRAERVDARKSVALLRTLKAPRVRRAFSFLASACRPRTVTFSLPDMAKDCLVDETGRRRHVWASHPAVGAKAIDRSHRIGQDKPVFATGR